MVLPLTMLFFRRPESTTVGESDPSYVYTLYLRDDSDTKTGVVSVSTAK